MVMKKENIAYLLCKLPIGLSFLGHGLVRIPKLQKFAEGMQHSFEETLLPAALVQPFALLLPFIELLLGLFLIIGIKPKITSIAGSILICILIFGCSFLENWQAVFIQMFYGAYLSVLYLFSDYNINILKSRNIE